MPLFQIIVITIKPGCRNYFHNGFYQNYSSKNSVVQNRNYLFLMPLANNCLCAVEAILMLIFLSTVKTIKLVIT